MASNPSTLGELGVRIGIKEMANPTRAIGMMMFGLDDARDGESNYAFFGAFIRCRFHCTIFLLPFHVLKCNATPKCIWQRIEAIKSERWHSLLLGMDSHDCGVYF
jgi:hypothetical protein